MSNKLGQNISQLLKERKMSQKQLAERICITESSLSRYISGEREPNMENLENIATALETTVDFLLNRENIFDIHGIKRILARNSSTMSNDEKAELINAILGKED